MVPRDDPPDPAAQAAHHRHVQQQLDEALADSFPASDPVSLVTSHQEEDEPPPAPDRPPRKNR